MSLRHSVAHLRWQFFDGISLTGLPVGFHKQTLSVVMQSQLNHLLGPKRLSLTVHMIFFSVPNRLVDMLLVTDFLAGFLQITSSCTNWIPAAILVLGLRSGHGAMSHTHRSFSHFSHHIESLYRNYVGGKHSVRLENFDFLISAN